MRIAATAALTLLLTGCSGASMESSAAGCWGTGAVASSAACQDALASPLAALGHVAIEGLHAARAGGGCGGFVDCVEAIKTTEPPPQKTPRIVRKGTPTPTPRGPAPTPWGATPSPKETPRVVASNDTPTPTPTPVDPGPKETPAEATPAPPAPTATPVQADPVATASSQACKGITISALESKASLTESEVKCATDAAYGRAGVSSSDVQIAAIALRNKRTKGWADAVEAALKQGSNGNAPLLNFAGIEHAYNLKRYVTVLRRARIVWQNRGKGYQFGAKDLDFVVEFSCRSAGQLALAGKPAGDGLDWCERWLDRAESAGKATQEIEDLIRQVE